MNPGAFGALPYGDGRPGSRKNLVVGARPLPAAVLVIGLISTACSSQVGPSATPTAAGPTAVATASPTTASPTTQPTVGPEPTAGPFAERLVAGLTTATDVPYTQALPCGAGECEVPLDVLAPERGEALPTIVLLPGGPAEPAERRYLAELAAAAAQRGAVVFLAGYRSEVTGDSMDESLHDVRCVIRFARSAAADYGGDPDRVVLVGHSYGSLLALQTAADGKAETPGCLADANGVPDAVVGMAGFGFALPEPIEAQPPILLISGSEDAAAAGGEGSAQRLRDAGFEAEYVELEGIDHFEIVIPTAARTILDLIFGAIPPAS